MFDARKTRMIGLSYGEKYGDDKLSELKPFSSNTGTSRTDGRTDGRTELLYQYRRITTVSLATNTYCTMDGHSSCAPHTVARGPQGPI